MVHNALHNLASGYFSSKSQPSLPWLTELQPHRFASLLLPEHSIHVPTSGFLLILASWLAQSLYSGLCQVLEKSLLTFIVEPASSRTSSVEPAALFFSQQIPFDYWKTIFHGSLIFAHLVNQAQMLIFFLYYLFKDVYIAKQPRKTKTASSPGAKGKQTYCPL